MSCHVNSGVSSFICGLVVILQRIQSLKHYFRLVIITRAMSTISPSWVASPLGHKLYGHRNLAIWELFYLSA